MATTFEYIVSLQDKVTAVADKVNNALNGIVERSKKLSNTMTSSLDGLKGKLADLHSQMGKTTDRSLFKKYYDEAKKLEQQIKRVENGITGSGLSAKFAGWRQDFADSLPGSNLMKNPIALAGAAVGGLWAATEKAMDAGKEKIKLQTLTGSQEIGGALYDNLTKFATDTVFGNEVYDMGVQMLANGIKDADVMPIMKELGDISMGDAQKLGSLSLAFAQINGKGKLAGQELLQLINAGFNPLQVISEKTGESMESLQKRMEKGQIGVDEVRYAMQLATGPGGKFQDMLQKVADTPYGQLEGLKGQLEQMMVKIGEVFLPIATKFMQFISWVGEKMGPYLQPVVAILGAVSAAILAVAAAQWVWNLAIWSNPITWKIAAIVALIALITYVITSIQGWGNAWTIMTNNAKLNWRAFADGAQLIWDKLVNGFMNGLNKIKTGWYQFKNAVGLGDEGENNSIISQIAADTDRRKKEIEDAQKKYNDATSALTKGSKNAFGALTWKGGSISDTKDKLINSLGVTPPQGIPGTGAGTDKDGKKSGLAKSGAKASEGIATGGTRHNYITLNIAELIGIQNYAGSKDSASAKAGEEIIDEILRLTASATTAAG